MIKKIHYTAGIIITIFISIHVLNHLMLVKGDSTHIEFMNVARKLYRNPFAETVLVLALVVQIASGVSLVRKKWKHAKNYFDRLQIWSGLYFVYFLFSHTAAVMIGRHSLHVDTNLYYGASPLNNDPVKYVFVFHYGLAILAFFIHTACIHRTKMKHYVSEKPATIQSWLIMALGGIVTLIILFNMMNVTIPKEYQFVPFGKY
jgi:succinate dehydrogenase/fumarate reductase cytochrome b subunit